MFATATGFHQCSARGGVDLAALLQITLSGFAASAKFLQRFPDFGYIVGSHGGQRSICPDVSETLPGLGGCQMGTLSAQARRSARAEHNQPMNASILPRQSNSWIKHCNTVLDYATIHGEKGKTKALGST